MKIITIHIPLLILALGIPSSLSASAPRQVSVELHFEGKESRRIIESIDMPQGRFVPRETLSEIFDSIFLRFAAAGYPLCRIDSMRESKSGDHAKLDVFIDSGEPLMTLNGRVTRYSGVEVAAERRATLAFIETHAHEILNDLTDEGYPFAQVQVLPGRIHHSEEALKAELNFTVERGPFLRIGSVDFPGLKFTNPRLLLLESRIKRGDTYNRTRLEAARSRLQRLEFLRDVGAVLVRQSQPGVAAIAIPVRDALVNQVSGTVAFAGRKAAPTGEFGVRFANLLGSGRRFEAAWRGLNPQRRGVHASYTEPWLLGKPIHPSILLEQWVYDTLGTSRMYRLGVDWEPSAGLTLTGAVASESFSKTGGGGSSAGMRSKIWIEAGLRLNRLNHSWNPTAGYMTQIVSEVGFAARRMGRRSDSRSRRESATIFGARSLTREWTVAGKLAVDDIAGDDVDVRELVRAGGVESVRGYVEEGILGRGFGWGSFELRRQLAAGGYLGLFIDGGSVYRADAGFAVPKSVLLSLGFSGAFITRAGRIEIAVGAPADEGAGAARLHVRLFGRM